MSAGPRGPALVHRLHQREPVEREWGQRQRLHRALSGQGTNVVGGPDDLVALVDYLGDHPNYVPVTTSRITRQN